MAFLRWRHCILLLPPALVYIPFAWINRATPFIFGFPFFFAWMMLCLLIGWLCLVSYYFLDPANASPANADSVSTPTAISSSQKQKHTLKQYFLLRKKPYHSGSSDTDAYLKEQPEQHEQHEQHEPPNQPNTQHNGSVNIVASQDVATSQDYL